MKFRFLILCICIPFLSIAQTDFSGMVNCFSQGDKDNAAAISLIKASIAAFDLGHVFEEKASTIGMDIILKNGNKHFLTQNELKQAQVAADLRLKNCKDSTALKYAVKCYALMAKQRQLEVPGTDYGTALKYLDGEVEVDNIYELLGLEKNVKKFRNGVYVEHLCGIVAWRGKDVVFSCNGLMDRKGKQINMSVFYRGRFQVVDEWDADMNPAKI
jgi:predicted XRE-type DNA-binding protein